MALQTSGPISLNDMHVEVGGSSNSLCSVNDADIRDLISRGANTSQNFQEYYGKSAETSLPSGGNVNGQAQLKDINASSYISSGGTLRIPSSMWVWSDSTSTAALTIDIPCTVINDGKIIGCGGRGGNAGYNSSTYSGVAGGPAINVTSSGVTITNSSGAYIAGGGGGGSTFSVVHTSGTYQMGGGGAGGGAGGGNGGSGGARSGNSTSGGSNATGGALNATGANGSYSDPYTGGGDSYASAGTGGGAGGGAGGAGGQQQYLADGGAGGRILPGSGGSGGGASGSRGVAGTAGGSGGSAGVNNTSYKYSDSQPGYGAGGGGGWGASGGQGRAGYQAGGAGGAAISGTSRTLSNSGTIYGST